MAAENQKMSQVADTSLMAYQKIQPQLANRRAEVYLVLHEASARGFDMTNMEIARLMKWTINRVTPRVYELRGLGMVVLSCRRRCGVTGEWAKAWKVNKE